MRGGKTAGAARTQKDVTHTAVQMAKNSSLFNLLQWKCALQPLVIWYDLKRKRVMFVATK